jgi:hypothetical protein
MNTKSILPAISRRSLVVLIAGFLLLAGVVPAKAQDAAYKGAAETVYLADIVARANPEGVMLFTGGYRKWSGPLDKEYGIHSSHKQLGFIIGMNPAYAQGSLYGEWKPVLYFQARLQYDGYRFFGANGALLSFPSADAKFGRDETTALKGQEETGWGQRVMVQPVITAKAGPVIIRNTTDLAYYRFDGKGPYFYEWEYDTLLKDGDYLIDNTTAFLMEAWKGPDAEMLLAGPFYQITNAASADITRQRIGVQAFWSPAGPIGSFSHPRVYGKLGVNLQDRNRDNELFLIVGMGFDF